jgi:hypothetical protein
MATLPEARYPSGKGEVCKTFMRRFDPDPRLQNFNDMQAKALKSQHSENCGEFLSFSD